MQDNRNYIFWAIIAATIIVLSLIFRDSLSQFINRTNYFEFDNGKIVFNLEEVKDKSGESVDLSILKGSLSSRALYHLMSAGLRYDSESLGGGPRINDDVKAALDELQNAELVEVTIGSSDELMGSNRDDGGASMDGEFADVRITNKGRVFLSEFGFCCEE